MSQDALVELVARALAEDVGAGDVTTEATVPADARARGLITQKAPGVMYGIELVQGLIGVRPLVEGVELEVGADDRSRDRLGLLVQRLDVDSAGRGFDPQLATADHSVDTALVPEVHEVGAEGSKPFGGELEVVRLGQAKQSQASERTTSYRVSKRS